MSWRKEWCNDTDQTDCPILITVGGFPPWPKEFLPLNWISERRVDWTKSGSATDVDSPFNTLLEYLAEQRHIQLWTDWPKWVNPATTWVVTCHPIIDPYVRKTYMMSASIPLQVWSIHRMMTRGPPSSDEWALHAHQMITPLARLLNYVLIYIGTSLMYSLVRVPTTAPSAFSHTYVVHPLACLLIDSVSSMQVGVSICWNFSNICWKLQNS